MKKASKFEIIFMAIFTTLITILSVTSIVLYVVDKRKKEDEELEKYLDSAIQ